MQSLGNYRPQRRCGQGNIFAPVHRGGVCLSACWDTTHPRSRHPLGAQTPWSTHPPGAHTPPEQTPHPGADTPLEQTPPQEADSGIRSMSSRYASYWNAFLLPDFFGLFCLRRFVCRMKYKILMQISSR